MVAAFSVSCLLLAATTTAWLAERRARSQAVCRARATDTSHAELVRVARLTAADLRSAALTVLGHTQSGTATSTGLAGTHLLLLDLAEALLRQTDTPGAPHRLQEETVKLGPVMDMTVAQVTRHLGPSRRAWRLADGLRDVTLRADRRALHQILLRVLTSAALATRDGDWIAVTAAMPDTLPGGFWTLTIEDEGAGLPVEAVTGDGRETRGLGVGLALAHTLMQAHGGTLTLESVALVGTRACLAFPMTRVVAEAPLGQG
jgi:signal transduction histidine kinase